MASKVTQGHIRPLLCQNHSSTFVHEPILMKVCMNASIMIPQYMTWYVTFMLWRSCMLIYFNTFWPNYNLDLRFYGQLFFFFVYSRIFRARIKNWFFDAKKIVILFSLGVQQFENYQRFKEREKVEGNEMENFFYEDLLKLILYWLLKKIISGKLTWIVFVYLSYLFNIYNISILFI